MIRISSDQSDIHVRLEVVSRYASHEDNRFVFCYEIAGVNQKLCGETWVADADLHNLAALSEKLRQSHEDFLWYADSGEFSLKAWWGCRLGIWQPHGRFEIRIGAGPDELAFHATDCLLDMDRLREALRRTKRSE
jgi:hypothetical protein